MKLKINELDVIKDYQKTKRVGITAKNFKIGTRSVSNILHKNNIPMRQQRKYKIGDIIGEIEIIDVFYEKQYQYLKCRCLHNNCGKEFTGKASILFVKKRKLFCCFMCGRNQYVPVQWHKGIHMTYWKRIERKARERGLELNISVDYIWNLYEKQNGKCALSGMDIKLDRTHRTNSKIQSQNTASLDRIDSTKGYIEGNVQWVYFDLNFMKWNTDNNLFIDRCHKITNFNGVFEPRIIELQKEKTKNNFKGYNNIAGSYFHHAKIGAINRNLSFNITLKDVWDLYASQCGRCKMTGEIIEFMRYYCDIGLQTASIDRIDSLIGYELSNIQIVHKDLNKMKGKLTEDKFKFFCKNVSEYQNILANPIY